MTNTSVIGPVFDLPHVQGVTATADEVANYLDTHGVVVIDRLVDAVRMDQLSQDLRTVTGCFYGAEGSFAGAHTVRNAGKPLGESKIAQELALHPLIRATIQQRLGKWCKRFVLGTCSAITVEAPPSPEIHPAPPQILHRDESMWGCSDWPWVPQTTSDRPELAVSVMWAVSDFTNRNGATRVIPGSHRWPRLGNESQEEDDDLGQQMSQESTPQHTQQEANTINNSSREPGTTHSSLGDNDDEMSTLESLCIPAVMSKGSVLLWSGATIHGQGAHAPITSSNTPSSSRREGLIFIYNVGWLRPEHNFHWAMPPDVWDNLSPELQTLMGKVGTNRAQHDWYTGPVYAQPLLGTAPVRLGNYPEDDSRDGNTIADTFVAGAT
jgi:ectoine hydroxylase-related dioxygenase (phytanoyl-CoA dioxygenase family)